MSIGLSVYVTVIGLFLWSFATIAWAVKKNREEPAEPTTTGPAREV